MAGHVPYLKRLPDDGTDPDPANPDCQSSKGVWVFETLARSTGKESDNLTGGFNGSDRRIRSADQIDGSDDWAHFDE